MDEIFIKKVRAAAVAGWWTVLIFYCILLIQWLAYWLIMNRQPEGMLCLWGKGFTWAEIRTIWRGQWWHLSSASELYYLSSSG